MIARALDAGVAASWMTDDEVCGADPRLRAELEDRGAGYVLAIGCDRRVTAGTGAVRPENWALVDIDSGVEPAGHRWLLIRRRRRTKELAFHRWYVRLS